MVTTVLILQLEGAEGADENLVIDRTPFTVGRDRRMDAQLPLREISGKHARFEYDHEAWWVTDLNSTNGTYLNGKKIASGVRIKLADGDYVSISKRLYRVTRRGDGPLDSRVGATVDGFDSEIVRGALELIQILGEQRTFPHFQPIVDLATRQPIGWEALGRATSNSGPIPVGRLFQLATDQGRETDLSLTFRESARHCAECHFCWPATGARPYLFFNLHPAEIHHEERFLQSLEAFSRATELRKWFDLVAEMPESWVSNVEQMGRVVEQLRSFDLLVAYDDYGQGQARLEDLVKVPPDFVKLDRKLIADLGASRAMQRIVGALVDTARDLHVRTIGEGIETEEELQACRDLGMELGQGYLLERPAPAYHLFHADPTSIARQRPQCPFVRLNLLPLDVE